MGLAEWKIAGCGLIIIFTFIAIWGVYRSGEKSGKNESKLNGMEARTKTLDKQRDNKLKSYRDALDKLLKRNK